MAVRAHIAACSLPDNIHVMEEARHHLCVAFASAMQEAGLGAAPGRIPAMLDAFCREAKRKRVSTPLLLRLHRIVGHPVRVYGVRGAGILMMKRHNGCIIGFFPAHLKQRKVLREQIKKVPVRYQGAADRDQDMVYAGHGAYSVGDGSLLKLLRSVRTPGEFGKGTLYS